MTVLDRAILERAPIATTARRTQATSDDLRCIVCRQPFDFGAGQKAVVLKHIAYGFDFAHDGTCLTTARAWIFAEPGYDRPAFSLDAERREILRVASADGWSAVMPAAPEQILAGTPVLFDALLCWALVEYQDGSRHLEGIVRASEWRDEPGGAEFPEAHRGRGASLGYVHAASQSDPARLASWERVIRARYRRSPFAAAA